MSGAAPDAYHGYLVELGVFSGPLDLLLHLIRREEIDIYDIPIARITDSYLHYIQALRSLDLQDVGEFLVMAATLMQIKSRMLLPRPPRDPEEDGEEEDPRAELVEMLLEYRRVQEAAQALTGFQEARRQIFTRAPVDGDRRALDPAFAEVSVFDLLWALDQVLERASRPDHLEMLRDTVTLAGQIRYLRGLLRSARQGCQFHELFSADFTRREVIVTFLALLELIGRGLVRAQQKRIHAPIMIEPTEALLR